MGNICSDADDTISDESKGNKQTVNGRVVKTNSSPIEIIERLPSTSGATTVWNLTQRQRDECEEIFSVFEEDDGKFIFT
jgi:hypothetical protein